MTLKVCLVLAAAFLGLVAGACDNAKTSLMSYTASDAQVLTHVPFIAQFSLTCQGVQATDVPLYANVDGNWAQVATTKDGAQYQLGWTKELKQAKPGDYSIDLYDEDGFSAIKRITERGEDPSSVKPLTTLTINYTGSYKGPYFSSELVALAVAFLAVYFAYTTQAKLLV